MNLTRARQSAMARYGCGLLLSGLSASAAVFDPTPAAVAEPPGWAENTSTSVPLSRPSTSAAGFVLQDRNGALVPLSADGCGTLPADGPIDSGTKTLMAGLEAPLVVRARALRPGSTPPPAPANLNSKLVPGALLTALGLWFAAYFSWSSHAAHNCHHHRTPRGFFKPHRKPL